MTLFGLIEALILFFILWSLVYIPWTRIVLLVVVCIGVAAWIIRYFVSRQKEDKDSPR